MDEVPPLVARANELARQAGFPLTRREAAEGAPSACLPGVGRFLAVLAARCRDGRIGEIGTGVGVGTAWMASAMPADCTLTTVEIDEQRASLATGLVAADPRVRVLTGDARAELTAFGPFDLLFADGGWNDSAGYASLVGLLAVGGQIVMDDVAAAGGPVPESAALASELKRSFFFGDPRLASAEIALPDLSDGLLVGTRLT